MLWQLRCNSTQQMHVGCIRAYMSSARIGIQGRVRLLLSQHMHSGQHVLAYEMDLLSRQSSPAVHDDFCARQCQLCGGVQAYAICRASHKIFLACQVVLTHPAESLLLSAEQISPLSGVKLTHLFTAMQVI